MPDDSIMTIRVPLESDLQAAALLSWEQRIGVQLLRNQEKIMATIQDIQAKVESQTTVIGSAVTLLQELSAEVKALKPDQASIDALAAKVDANTQQLAQAVASNTEAAPSTSSTVASGAGNDTVKAS